MKLMIIPRQGLSNIQGIAIHEGDFIFVTNASSNNVYRIPTKYTISKEISSNYDIQDQSTLNKSILSEYDTRSIVVETISSLY